MQSVCREHSDGMPMQSLKMRINFASSCVDTKSFESIQVQGINPTLDVSRISLEKNYDV